MNKTSHDPADETLASLLRESRPDPALPPRFQDAVWRRIEHPGQTRPAVTWMEAIASLLIRPRFAIAAVVALIVIGGVFGSLQGVAEARHSALQLYLAAVVGPVNR